MSRKRHTCASLRAVPLALHGLISILLLGKKPQVSIAHATDLAGRLSLATAGAEREASIAGRNLADGAGRAEAAELNTHICNHTWRGTGITTYLENGGTLENAKVMAAHVSVRTTQLYDRRRDDVTLDEVVKINTRG